MSFYKDCISIVNTLNMACMSAWQGSGIRHCTNISGEWRLSFFSQSGRKSDLIFSTCDWWI